MALPESKLVLRNKCILIGNAGVGKSTIASCFHAEGSQFQKNYVMTIQPEIHVKVTELPSDSQAMVEFYLLDIPGHDAFQENFAKYISDANTFCLVFDTSSAESFKNCAKWIHSLRKLKTTSKKATASIPGVLIANKIDRKRVVSKEQGEDFAKQYGLGYFECSCRSKMSGIQYIFGNVDEGGKLEETAELDKEVLDSLEQGAEYLETFLSSHLFDDGRSKREDGDLNFIKPNKDAKDYSEIQELAAEETSQSDMLDIILPTPVPLEILTESAIPNPALGVKKSQTSLEKIKLSQIFADVKRGKIRFTEIFGPRLPPTSEIEEDDISVPEKKPIRKIEDEGYKLAPDSRDLFFKHTETWDHDVVDMKQNSEGSPIKLSKFEIDKSIEKSYLPIELDPWERRIVWDSDEIETHFEPESGYQKMGNDELDGGDWLDRVLFDDRNVPKVEKTFEDPAITLDIQTIPLETLPKINRGKVMDRFNLSEDVLYEQIKNNRSDRVRQVAGPVVIEHALPAFKPHMTTRELRYFHRPAIRFPLNQEIRVNRLKLFKKKKARGKDPSELMKHPRNITLRDTCQYVLLEYSEEYPPVMQNPGMASMIYNYYRKKDEKDTYAPKMANGAAYVLEAVDASPFFGFGDVEPGQTMQAIYNHLFRAPIFKQDIPSTDFLLIKHTYKGKTRFYIREIQNVYVTGQLYPVQEVPRPKSRRVLHLTRNRILAVAFRMMHRDPLLRLKFVSLHKIFSGYTELELRNKIKDFLVYAKKGENTGWWKLNAKTPLPNEDGIRKLITPEMVCLMESALAGQQRLNDSGYGNIEFNENDEGAEEATGDVELMMAPWVTSKNFVVAAAGKGMIQLYGLGDPTGCGEAFSFLRASMKEMFFREGETEEAKAAFMEEKKKTVYHRFSIVEQQQVYKSEIARIWKNQLNSLGYIDDRIKDTKHKSKNVELPLIQTTDDESSQRLKDSSVASTPMPMSPSAPSRDADAYSDIDDTQSNATSHALRGKNRILVINRLVRDSDTQSFVWKSEVITDTKVMRAYLRQRAILERIEKDGSQPPLTEEDEKLHRKKRIQDYLTNLRLSRRGKRKEVDADLIDDGTGKVTVKIPMPSTSTTKRRKSEGPEQVASMKLVLKKRAPEVELNQMLDKFVKHLISLPESWPFTKPVSSEHFQDYYEIVKNPKTLQDIQDDVARTKYLSASEFMADLELIASNCQLYNGNHPLTNIAQGLVQKGAEFIKEHQIKIDNLHGLIERESLNVISEEMPSADPIAPEPSVSTEETEGEEIPVAELGEGFIFNT